MQKLITSHKRKYIPFPKQSSSFSTDNFQFYKAVITGHKKSLPLKLRRTLKTYGLTHLLTPSGIHLSAILIFFRFFRVIQLPFLILLGLYLYYLGGYYSLERIILFRIIFLLINKVEFFKPQSLEISFILTMLIYFLTTRADLSPLSFAYSLAFWGTIICYRHHGVKLVFYLHLALIAMASVNSEMIKISSLVINPLITFLFSLVT